jgi:hypothetical protein
MPQESENKRAWLPDPKFARRVLWVTVGLVGWFILMLLVLEMSLGEDSHGGGAIVLPIVVVFVAVAYGFTFVIPDKFPVARSTVSLVFLLIALVFSGAFTFVLL